MHDAMMGEFRPTIGAYREQLLIPEFRLLRARLKGHLETSGDTVPPVLLIVIIAFAGDGRKVLIILICPMRP